MSDKAVRRLFVLCVVAAASVAALAIASVILLLLGANVFDTFKAIFIYPFSTLKTLSGVINIMTPLCLVGVGTCIAYRSGIINLGGEGQMYMGILLALILALNTSSWPKIIALPCILLCGMIGGAVWGAVPGILKTRFHVSELLSTVMLNYTAAQFYSYMIRVPLLDPAMTTGAGEPTTAKLVDSQWLHMINQIFTGADKNLRFHTGIFIAVIIAIVFWVILFKTPLGYKMRAAGASEKAARYGGINVSKYVVLAVMLSGACCGLAGTVEILGLHHKGITACTGGYGFSGIVVALFAGLHPIWVLPAGFFFAVISYGCSSLQINKIAVPSNVIDVLMGLVILVIVISKMVIGNKYMLDKFRRFITRSGRAEVK